MGDSRWQRSLSQDVTPIHSLYLDIIQCISMMHNSNLIFKKSYFDKACIHIAASSSSEHNSAVVKRVDITVTVKITILDFLRLGNTVVCRLFSDFLELEE